MSDEIKALARRIFEEVWNREDPSVVAQLYADDYVAHVASTPEPIRGVERFQQFVALFRVLSPDLHFEIEDQIAEGDKVVTRWTARGTTAGSLAGAEPTGDLTTVTGISIHRLANGKFVESWDNWDALTAMQALGTDVFESISLSL